MPESVVRGPVVSGGQVLGLTAWQGRRVVLRYLLADGRATDVLGTLVRVYADGPSLTVRSDADGSDVPVPGGAVVVVKLVPPRPPRRAPRSVTL